MHFSIWYNLFQAVCLIERYTQNHLIESYTQNHLIEHYTPITYISTNLNS